MNRLARKVKKYIKEIRSGKETSFRKLYDCTYRMVRERAITVSAGQEALEETLCEVYKDIFENVAECREEDGYAWFCARAEEKILKIGEQRKGKTEPDKDTDKD
jgi:hypothetical protein